MSCLDINTVASMYAAAVPLIQYNSTINTYRTHRCFEQGCYKFNIQYTLDRKPFVATGNATGTITKSSAGITEFLITSFTVGNNTAMLHSDGFSIGSCFYTINFMFDHSQLVYKQQTSFGIIEQNILHTSNQSSFVSTMDGSNINLTFSNIVSIISEPLIGTN